MDIQQLTNAMDAYGGNVAGTTNETAQRRGRTSNAATSAQGDTVQVSQDGQLLNVARKARQIAQEAEDNKIPLEKKPVQLAVEEMASASKL